jgi:hypothetical protein
MDNREMQVGKIEKQLAQWGARLDELAAKAATAGEDVIQKERQHIAELRAKRDEFAVKLQEMKAAGSDKWQTIKSGVDSAYDELEAAFRLVTK